MSLQDNQQVVLSSVRATNNGVPQTSQLNRRSKLETYCDILKAIGSGAGKPTHILYRANLSWTVLQNCLNTLEIQGLIQVVDDDGRKAYRLSDRGFKLLEQYLSLSEGLNLTQKD